jgi:hypothetical protein
MNGNGKFKWLGEGWMEGWVFVAQYYRNLPLTRMKKTLYKHAYQSFSAL